MSNEPQPEAPDLGEFVQEDTAETLTSDDLGADPLDAGYVPPDRPTQGLRRAPSVDETGERRSLDERMAEEEPGDEEATDDVAEPRSGRLADTDEGPVYGTDVGVDGGAASAEEAAVHEKEEG